MLRIMCDGIKEQLTTYIQRIELHWTIQTKPDDAQLDIRKYIVRFVEQKIT